MGSWESYIIIAVIVVGVLEHLKGWHAGKGWIWRLVQVGLSLAVGAQVLLGPSWLTASLMGLAISQLGHDLIIKLVEKKLDA